MASAHAKEGLEPARWQRSLLPGSMVDGPGADRSLRDWAVDALVTVVALGIGVLALHDTWHQHGTAALVLDLGLGVASIAALWDRRRHPVGVAAFVIPAAAVSALAGGAGLIVRFNAAAELHLSVAAVKAHVSKVMEKLGVGNRVQVALLIPDASPPGGAPLSSSRAG